MARSVSPHNAVILESITRMAYYTVTLAGDAQPIASELHDKHFLRKHGDWAYYGQVR
jgi:L-ribulose-5-phosphate 4-epimerase